MNKHVELVKKWLADPKSVSLEELKANKEAAWAATWDIRDAASNAADAAYAAYAAADDDAYGAAGAGLIIGLIIGEAEQSNT